jgi:ubiquinone/menaquinone biosynthesis C-methylase UbiE
VDVEAIKERNRQIWGLGDYSALSEALRPAAEALADACAVSAGQEVLDVAAGDGNFAIACAREGASVVASDLSPGMVERGRARAQADGYDIEWVEADAEALPFGDGEFDVVTSSLGAIFAPDHRAVARELLRVCRPGGTIGMINFTPEGLAGDFFALFAGHAPPPPEGALPPVLWGSEDHVRELFGDGVAALELTRRRYVERSPGGPEAYCDFFKATFGPVVGLYAALADRPERRAALDRDFLEFARRADAGPPEGPAEYPYEYLLVVARGALSS